ncbi:MAG: succinylglutamate desuccinylase [Halobacteriovorax sp.]|nr:succinylglutamate desuccinylase [Halobacteriovorax sp.]|tara:strand:- start:92293 stop:93447 length:1155 start_codon:yes stop_codon:yes gene_type:complete
MNKLERINHPLKQQPNGDWLWINIFRCSSGLEGPNVHIQANVHGAELQGNAVIFELMNWFKTNPFKGSISFIPFANPTAVNQKSGMYTQGRYNPVSGNNWNRNYINFMALDSNKTGFSLEEFVKENIKATDEEVRKKFKTELFKICDHYQNYVEQRAHGPEDGHFNLLMQKIASPSDIVLDLHTGPIAARYLYSADYQISSAAHFKFPHVLEIPSEFDGAMDEASFMPWVELTKEFKKQGRDLKNSFEAYTVELGSEERISFEEAKLDAKCILNFLKHKGVHDIEISDLPKVEGKKSLLKDYRTYYAPKGGLYEFCFSPGESFKKGDVIARSLSFKQVKNEESLSKAIEEVTALEDGIVVNHNTSASIASGQTLYQVMENVSNI